MTDNQARKMAKETGRHAIAKNHAEFEQSVKVSLASARERVTSPRRTDTRLSG